MAKVTITVDIGTGKNPFTSNTTLSKRAKLRRLAELLRKVAAGGGINTATSTVASRGTHPTVTAGTAAASGTITFSGSATGCTVVVNGVTFTGGQYAARVRATLVTPVATNAVTLQLIAFTAAQLNARATATFTSAIAGNTVTVGATTFVGTAGAVTAGAATFSIDTSDTATAASFKAQVEAHAVAGLLVGVTVSAGVAKIRTLLAGTAGNAIILSRVGAPIALTATGGGALTGAFLQGGLAQSVAGWDYGDTDTQGAAALAAVVNASTNMAILGVISATSALGVATFAAATDGTAGNALTVTKTGAPVTLTAQGGGADTGVFQNGAAPGTNTFGSLAAGSSDTRVAASLAASINRTATAGAAGVVIATSAAAVTTISSATLGLIGNSVTLTAAGTGPTASASKLSGGTVTTLTF